MNFAEKVNVCVRVEPGTLTATGLNDQNDREGG